MFVPRRREKENEVPVQTRFFSSLPRFHLSSSLLIFSMKNCANLPRTKSGFSLITKLPFRFVKATRCAPDSRKTLGLRSRETETWFSIIIHNRYSKTEMVRNYGAKR